MNSLDNQSSWIGRNWYWVALAGVLAAALFLLVSIKVIGVGFPLDDAWIHQTYARNLAQFGEWSFIPGQPSAGSTSPAWSAILALGHLLNQGEPFALTFFLGIICLVGIGIIGQAIFARSQNHVSLWPIAGILLVGEWHLVWASVSGMETALMGVLILWVVWWLIREEPRWEVVGFIISASIWVRPDGLTLLGPAVMVLLITESGGKKISSSLVRLIGCFLLVAVPYLLFNRLTNGSFWPNTFYAKQAEYAALQQEAIWLRYARLLFLPMTGVGIFLLPGFIFSIFDTFRRRQWGLLAAGIWFLGYAGIYAVRLPVTYQHGRYLMPAMAVFFLIGMIGTAKLLQLIPKTRLGFILSRALLVSAGVVWLAFLGIGAQAYAADVGVIQTEMVDTANWVAENTQPDDLIAAHDIGALGYFGHRRIIDLAGLISPEVVPFIRDEEQIAAYLTAQGVDYLVTFPDWYPQLTEGLVPVYQTSGKFAPAAEVENMSVYRWK